MKLKILLAACVLDLTLSEEFQRGLMFLSPTIGLSRKRTAMERNLEYHSIFRGAQELPSQSRFIKKHDSSIAAGTSISANTQPSATIRIAGGSNRYFLRLEGFDITCALYFSMAGELITNKCIYRYEAGDSNCYSMVLGAQSAITGSTHTTLMSLVANLVIALQLPKRYAKKFFCLR